jgi:hypothetical protein
METQTLTPDKPSETVETETPAASQATDAAPPAPKPEQGSPLKEWNGELESLTKAPWYTGLDPAVRVEIERGLAAKYREYDRGFQAKMRSAAEEKKRFESEMQTLRSLFHDGDEAAQIKSELEELRTFKSGIEAERQKQAAAQEEALLSTLNEKYGDIITHADEAVMDKFAALLESGFEADEAADLIRTKYKIQAAAPEAEPEPAPARPAYLRAAEVAAPPGRTEVEPGRRKFASLEEQMEAAADRASSRLGVR